MPLDMGKMLAGSFASEAFPTAGQGTISSDMGVQVNGTSMNSVPASGMSGASSSANARQSGPTKNILYGATAIVIVAIVLLWLLGAIVLKVK